MSEGEPATAGAASRPIPSDADSKESWIRSLSQWGRKHKLPEVWEAFTAWVLYDVVVAGCAPLVFAVSLKMHSVNHEVPGAYVDFSAVMLASAVLVFTGIRNAIESRKSSGRSLANFCGIIAAADVYMALFLDPVNLSNFKNTSGPEPFFVVFAILISVITSCFVAIRGSRR